MRYREGLVDEQLWKRGVRHWLMAAFACTLIFSVDRVGWVSGLRQVLEQGMSVLQKPLVKSKQVMGQPLVWVMRGRDSLHRLADLESRLAEAAVDKVKLVELETKLKDMESMYQIMPSGKRTHQLAPVYVVNDKVIIGAGEREGVRLHQLVTDKRGVLVGKVVLVGSYTSRVQTPKDVGFKLAVQTSDGRAKGILESSGSQVLLSGVLQTESLQPGDVLVTSGIDESAPPNIVVGQVTRLTGNPADPTKGAEVALLSNYEGWAAIW